MTPPLTPSQAFRKNLRIERLGESVLFSDVIEDWQRTDFEALDGGWEVVAGVKPRTDGDFLRAYIERARGHSKTADIASMAAFALYACDYKIKGVAAASDKDQAGFMRDALDKLVRLNPWVAERLEVQNWRIVNKLTGSELKIISSDVAGSYGETPDFVIIDELTHWKKSDLWTSLFSSAAKRPNCLLMIIANAGFGKGISWQWKVRQMAALRSNWYFSRLEGPQAKWITGEVLAEQREGMPTIDYVRLWLNEWVTQASEGLEAADIEACFSLTTIPNYDPGLEYLIGVDLGVKHDHSAIFVIGVDAQAQRFKMMLCRSWSPNMYPDGKIRLADVQDAILDAHAAFNLSGMLFDPNQCLKMAQDIQEITAGDRRYPRMLNAVEWNFVPKNMMAMAVGLLQVFRNRQIELYQDPQLMTDLLRLEIESTPRGYKLTAVSDEAGHADRAIALAIVLPAALEWAHHLYVHEGDDDGLGDGIEL